MNKREAARRLRAVAFAIQFATETEFEADNDPWVHELWEIAEGLDPENARVPEGDKPQ